MKILMVCLGNICRSPLAEGIMRHKIHQKGLEWTVDSCGTSGFHDGEQPDTRSIFAARQHDIDITDQRSRRIKRSDLEEFDLILAMDSSNFSDIQRMCNSQTQKDKVKLILNALFPMENRAVPDPYYDGGFDKVYDMLSDACDRILENPNF